MGRRILIVAAIGSLLIGLSLFSARAWAQLADLPDDSPGQLQLSSDPVAPEFLDLAPGTRALWQVGARLTLAEAADLTLQVRKGGALAEHPSGLTVTIDGCPTPWTDSATAPECDGAAIRLIHGGPTDTWVPASPVVDAPPISADAGYYFLVSLALDSSAEPSDESLMGLTATLSLGLTASGADTVAPDSGNGPENSEALPLTGVEMTAAVLIGAGAITAGLALRRRPAVSAGK